ncbi:LysR family transcriptional regulator [Methylobacterium terricola]|nr:LysR substrate-binding domain-containing protein [Methylobacterium terricola]
MQLKWLEDFVAYAATRSFTKAAEMRNVTHPAFGRRIRALEGWVGVPLIDRGSFPAALTPAGEDLLDVARTVCSDLAAIRAELRRRHTRDDDILTIATGRTLARTFFSNVRAAIAPLRPAVPLRLVTGSVHDAMIMLADETADLVLCYAGPAVEIDHTLFESRVVGAETLIAVRGSCGPAFGLEAGTRSPFLKYSETMALGRVVARALTQRGLSQQLDAAFEADMAETLLDGALQGHGIAWLPAALVTGELAGGRLVRVEAPDDDITVEIRLCRRKRDRRRKMGPIWRAVTDGAA